MHLSLQNGLAEAPVNKSRKQIKERKNRTKKIRGVKKNAGACITVLTMTEQRGRPLSSTWGQLFNFSYGSTHPAALPTNVGCSAALSPVEQSTCTAAEGTQAMGAV